MFDDLTPSIDNQEQDNPENINDAPDEIIFDAEFGMVAPLEPEVPRPRVHDRRTVTREILETLLLIIGIYTLVNLATARFVVEGQSMFPSFEGGEFLVVSRLEYIFGDPRRGDIVVFHYPQNPQRDFIKRIIGLPGETVVIDHGKVHINGVPLEEPYVADLCSSAACNYKAWELGEDEYFVLGDNRNASQDSSNFGPVDRSFIIGRAWIKYWPSEDWGIMRHHEYGVTIPDEAPPLPTPTPLPEATQSPFGDSMG